MALISNTSATYNIVTLKQDALDKIFMFEREETPVYSSSPKEKCISTKTEWFNDTLTAAGSNAMAAGEVLTAEALTQATKSQNHTQILRKVVSVTGTNQAVDPFGTSDTMQMQMAKKMRELKRDAEYAITQNVASVASAAGVTPKLGGIETFITTNASRGAGGSGTGYNSGTGLTVAPTDGTQRVFTLDLLNTVLQTGYNNGAKFNKLHLGAFNKNRFSNFSGNATRTSEEKSTISTSITVYESDFGTITAAINPLQRTRVGILYGEDSVAIRNLRPIGKGKLAKTNDSDEEYILTEFTTRVVEKSMGIIADLTTA